MQPQAPTSRQLVKYSFYKISPDWYRLPATRRADDKAEFAAVVQRHANEMPVRTYSTVGTRADCDLCLRVWSSEVEQIHRLHRDLAATALGPFLHQAHSYLALLRKSIYVHIERDRDHPDRGVTHSPAGKKYLFIYPFVKTRPWYMLSMEDRQRMMDEHIAIGRSYPGITINTSYSFGLDDQEFVVAFEGDKIGDFLDLVMELRSSEASQYTLRDTPNFTCLAMPIEAALDALDG